ncbi:hypothetical protein [Deinococcus radiotolerans]|uniref:Leucine rich repeat variant n=1 Tax=Deinococcus radiotolerans TaxID=1309407 RepID=A0ABQ2FRD8_9DEIO|nr:hypothetical protein [Deinococcus radiotolerans]GGL18886.1 hypothetical protein GCM10010844_42270 [Deinococcus radiotolerans]
MTSLTPLQEAASPDTTPERLILLATGADAAVRDAARANARCPSSLLELVRMAETKPHSLLGVHLEMLAQLGSHAQAIAAAHPKRTARVLSVINGHRPPEPPTPEGAPPFDRTVAGPAAPVAGAVHADDLRQKLKDRRAPLTLDPDEHALIRSDRRLQRLAARHPQLPVDLLVWIDARQPYGQARETLLTRLAEHPLEPELLAQVALNGDWEERAAVARNAFLPDAARSALCGDEDWWVRAAAAENPAATPADLTHLAQDTEHVTIREHVAAHPHAPGDVLLRLAQDGDPAVRLQAARNPSTPPEALDALAQDPRFTVREAVAAHALCPGDVLRALAADPNERVQYVAQLRLRPLNDAAVGEALATRRRHVKLALSVSGTTPATAIGQLARDRNPQVRAQVALHPHLSDSALSALAQDPAMTVRLVARAADGNTAADQLAFLPRFDARVRQALSRNHSAPAPVLDDLSEDPLLDVRLNVVLNPAAPGEALKRRLAEQPLRPDLRRHPRYEHELRDTLQAMELREAERPDATPEALHELSHSDGPRVRTRVAGHSHTGQETLLTLARDPELTVREAVVQRREELPLPVQRALATDLQWDIRVLLVKRKDLDPAAMLDLLLRPDEDEALLEDVARHPRVNEEVLTALARHANSGARRAAAQHQLTPPALLYQLAYDPQAHVQRSLLKNRACPPQVLILLSRQATMRLDIVHHVNTNEVVLEHLAYDAAYDRYLRAERWLKLTPFKEAALVQRWRAWMLARASAGALEHSNVLPAVIEHPRATERAVAFARRLRGRSIDEALRRRRERLRAEHTQENPT